MIRVENLSYVYSKGTTLETKALENINFSLQSGDSLGVIGETGSGKSTLVQLISGLVTYKIGKIFIDGKLVGHKPNSEELRKKIGIVFQDPEYQFFCDTVKDEFEFGLKNFKIEQSVIDKKVAKIVYDMNIDTDWLSKSPFELSGGEKRKVAIASILIMEPQILILDEPTSGLDSISRKETINIVKSIKNLTKIIISHNMDDICNICNKLIVLKDGKQFYFGDIEKFFYDNKLLIDSNLEMPEITKTMSLVEPDKTFIRIEDAVKFLKSKT